MHSLCCGYQQCCGGSNMHSLCCGHVQWWGGSNMHCLRCGHVCREWNGKPVHAMSCEVELACLEHRSSKLCVRRRELWTQRRDLHLVHCREVQSHHGKFCLHGLPRGEIHRRGGDVVVRLLRDAAGGVHAESVCAISRPGRHLVHELPLGEVRRPGPWQTWDPRRALLQRVSSRGVPDDYECARNRWRWGSSLHSVLVVFRFAEHDESGV